MTVQETQRWVEDKLLADRDPFPASATEGDIVLKVRNPAHWQVLRSPYRMRIFEAVRSANGCAIKDLADALASSTTALYYHLDLLMRAGLITSTVSEADDASQSRGGRRPAVFLARGERLVIEYDPASGRERRRIAAVGRAWIDEAHAEVVANAAQSHAPTTIAWEHLTAAESEEIRAAFARVEGVLAQARARRDCAGTGVQCSNHHVAYGMVASRTHVLPSPVMQLREGAALEPVET